MGMKDTAHLVSGDNVSLAWLASVNLVVAVVRPTEEVAAVRARLDTFVAVRRRNRVPLVRTVANTIFPSSLYFPDLGDQARPHLYENYQFARPIARLHHANNRGIYFDRLVAWPGEKGPINQLERMIRRLRRQLETSGPMSSAYELAVSAPDDVADLTESSAGGGDGELRIFRPDLDNSIMGFPCLSHISLTLAQRQLHMTALYRNQGFIQRAYGNLLGLGSLLNFLAHEAGCTPGELVCVATHADLEIGTKPGFGKATIAGLIDDCDRAVQEQGHLHGSRENGQATKPTDSAVVV
jgi:hypothetical protein